MNKKYRIDWVSTISIPISFLVFSLKYFSYYLTDSIAIYSDALESIVNIITAFTVWFAIQMSLKPADKNHPFGHHKAEYFSSVFEGILIILAANLILYQAWSALQKPHIPKSSDLGIIINFISGILNFSWAFFLINHGKQDRSPALEADGWHLMTDVVTSLGVFFGFIATVWSGYYFLDPLLGMLVAIHVLWQGWKIIHVSVKGLMDTGVEIEENMRIKNIISTQADGAMEAHDLRTRLAGRITFIEFHLVVPSKMTVNHAHLICDRIEDALCKEIQNAKVIIHIEPENEAKLPPGTLSVPFA